MLHLNVMNAKTEKRLPRGTVIAAMSGGVDSSVAAYLMLKAGYDVIGMTLHIWPCNRKEMTSTCCGYDDMVQAETVCESLGIPHHVIHCFDAFEKDVLTYSWREYKSGRTPNPCVVCNRAVKFKILMDHADKLGAEYVATGHYAIIEPYTRTDGNAGFKLLRGQDPKKDQSYYLSALTGEQLARAKFPLGELTKPEVREIARDLNLPNAEKKESQDACLTLIGEQFGETLRQIHESGETTGNIVDTEGKVLGTHNGIHRFTIGQRRGLNIALGKPAYVTAIHANTGEVVISCDPADLLHRTFTITGARWINPDLMETSMDAEVQIRYMHRARPARLTLTGQETATVEFKDAQRAITPGQAAVAYTGTRVLGGGWIQEVIHGSE